MSVFAKETNYDKLKMFNVYDSKAETFMMPFYCRTSSEALRQAGIWMKDPESMFAKFPADFTLFEMGTFVPKTGVLEMRGTKLSLGTLLEIGGSTEKPALEVVN